MRMCLSSCSAWLVFAALCSGVAGLPIINQGVFILQGISSCDAGEGYCMLGKDCTIDLDFMASDDQQNCDGLKDAFTPSVNFTCCRFNELGKAASEAPTTEISSFTITDVEQFLQDEIPIMEYQDNNEIPEGVDPSTLIDIVGVVTDMTGVIALITEQYTGTIPSLTTVPSFTATTTTTTTTTTPAPLVVIAHEPVSNSSHSSISLSGILSRLKITTTTAVPTTIPPTTTVRTASTDLSTDSTGEAPTTEISTQLTDSTTTGMHTGTVINDDATENPTTVPDTTEIGGATPDPISDGMVVDSTRATNENLGATTGSGDVLTITTSAEPFEDDDMFLVTTITPTLQDSSKSNEPVDVESLRKGSTVKIDKEKSKFISSTLNRYISR